jgi:isopentenyl-diphosphate delta-isomerase
MGRARKYDIPSGALDPPRLTVGAVDYILFIKADVDLDVNPNEVRDTRFVSQEDLKEMFKDPSLKFTPWFKLICQSMLFEWWSHLDSGLEMYMGETEIRRM